MIKVIPADQLVAGYQVAMTDTTDISVIGFAQALRDGLTARQPLGFQTVDRVTAVGRYVHIMWHKNGPEHRYPADRMLLVETGNVPENAMLDRGITSGEVAPPRRYERYEPGVDFKTQLQQAKAAGHAAAVEQAKRVAAYNENHFNDVRNYCMDLILCAAAGTLGGGAIVHVRGGFEERVMKNLLQELGFSFSVSETNFDPIPGYQELSKLVNFCIEFGETP